MNNMEDIVNYLIKNSLKISTMESATGGFIASSITNVPGSSDVFSFSAVTYSNEYKVKFGVPKEVIDKYTVYSIETARSMANAISKFTGSDIGIGTTGKINREDKNNPFGENNIVFASIYLRKENKYIDMKVKMTEKDRLDNKKLVLESIVNELKKCYTIND